jgi:hypothetical protein
MREQFGDFMIDWTISVSGLIQVAALLVAGLGAFFTLRADIRVINSEMTHMKDDQHAMGEVIKQQTNVLSTLAAQQVRLDRAEKLIDEMRHGQGFVNPMRS